jgi:protein-tyrosine phosphatase
MDSHAELLSLFPMSLFSKIFGTSPKTTIPADLGILKCDLHSHFIPGIDDGSRNMDDSLNMIASFAEMGYKKVITTPHIMSDFYKNTPEIILGGLENVRTALKENNIPIEIEAAAEYYIDFDFEEKMKKGKLLTLGKNYVLVEISFINPPENLNDIFFKLLTNGYKPILAHPERYNFWHTDFEKYESIIEKGVLLQLNINSLTGHYSPATKRIAERMIENNMISFLGSDCHNMGHVELIKKVVYEKSLHTLLGSGKLLNSTL